MYDYGAFSDNSATGFWFFFTVNSTVAIVFLADCWPFFHYTNKTQQNESLNLEGIVTFQTGVVIDTHFLSLNSTIDAIVGDKREQNG